ncbi:MAG TPA: DUF3617 domain-containing protein [Acidobacteriaceae bacterium]|nr:DUF3617 domain-containing protein [Acidobacteriaceae bacterium]
MKLRFTLLAPLPLLLTFATVASAQLDPNAPPPIKMGLWQSEVTITDAANAASPMARSMGNHTTVTQGCLTPDSWKKDIQGMQNRQRQTDCNTANFEQDAHHVAFDVKCAGQGGYASDGHFEMLIDDPENGHGHVDMKMSGPAFPDGMTMHMTMKTKFLSSDCGDVKPGQGKTIRQ